MVRLDLRWVVRTYTCSWLAAVMIAHLGVRDGSEAGSVWVGWCPFAPYPQHPATSRLGGAIPLPTPAPTVLLQAAGLGV